VARALTVARVSVQREREGEYLAVLGRLASELGSRGHHLWAFRHPTEPGTYLEFHEAGDPGAHASVAPTPREAELRRTLRGIGAYAPGADDLWLEVPLAE